MSIRQAVLASAFIATLLGGCATNQPIAVSPQPQSSAIGIQVVMGPKYALSVKSNEIFFVKLEGGSLLDGEIIRSNFSKDGRVYLLNAPPGVYVAVAGSYPGPSMTPYGQATKVTTYFSRGVVEKTEVAVRENEFVFMGSFHVDISIFSGSDDVQSHYQKIISPDANVGWFLNVLSGKPYYWGSLLEGANDERTRTEFFRNASDDLAGSGWASRLNQPTIK